MAITVRVVLGQGGKRGCSLESVTARVCREAGGTVATNVMVRDLDLAAFAGADGRRLEVVVDGLPFFGGSQLAVDATLVSALHANGQARRGAAQEDGAALITARRRKERRYPELVGPGAQNTHGVCDGALFCRAL